MDCLQCHQPIETMANVERLNPGGEGAWAVGWCGLDIHLACVPLHVRSCRACWPHNAGYILVDDQRRASALAVDQREARHVSRTTLRDL